MHPLDFPILADENIHPDVVKFMKEQSKDVSSVLEEGLAGQGDLTILRHACHKKRIVMTHDSDFGALAILHQEPIIGIIYLRPGHISGEFTSRVIKTLTDQSIDIQSPFIIVAAFKHGKLQIRVRQLSNSHV